MTTTTEKAGYVEEMSTRGQRQILRALGGAIGLDGACGGGQGARVNFGCSG